MPSFLCGSAPGNLVPGLEKYIFRLKADELVQINLEPVDEAIRGTSFATICRVLEAKTTPIIQGHRKPSSEI